MKRLFLEKFFPNNRATNIRKEIYSITWISEETLYEYWERFKWLCACFPHYQISNKLFIQYFYEGMLPLDGNMINTAGGGALVNKTAAEARQLISIMAENSQQFRSRAPAIGRISQDNKVIKFI